MLGRELDTCPAEIDARVDGVDPRYTFDGDVGGRDTELGVVNLCTVEKGVLG